MFSLIYEHDRGVNNVQDGVPEDLANAGWYAIVCHRALCVVRRAFRRVSGKAQSGNHAPG